MYFGRNLGLSLTPRWKYSGTDTSKFSVTKHAKCHEFDSTVLTFLRKDTEKFKQPRKNTETF